MRAVLLLCLCLTRLLGCDSKPKVVEPEPEPIRLNTASHEEDGLSWEDSPIEADTRWRFLASRETEIGFEVTGAWEITLRNTSSDEWEAVLSRLTFEDRQGFQIAEYYIGSFPYILQGHESRHLQGNFDIQVVSLELANSIRTMNLWASFKISD